MNAAPHADSAAALPDQPPTDGIKLRIGGPGKASRPDVPGRRTGPIVDYVGNCNDLSFRASESCSEV
jgi:hypothetical protein